MVPTKAFLATAPLVFDFDGRGGARVEGNFLGNSVDTHRGLSVQVGVGRDHVGGGVDVGGGGDVRRGGVHVGRGVVAGVAGGVRVAGGDDELAGRQAHDGQQQKNLRPGRAVNSS